MAHTNGHTTNARSKAFPHGYSSRLNDEVTRLDVWSVFSPASGYVPKESINLGQGFMNWAPPKYVRQAFDDALETVEPNHYSIPRGRIRLRQALAETYGTSLGFQDGGKLDPNTDILVTAGANGAIYAFFTAFLEPDGVDEVIVFSPHFDQYVSNIKFNGGKPVYVPLQPPKASSSDIVSKSSDWTVDFDELQKAISPNTRAIILNTPHNPVGKVFTREEISKIGALAKKHDFLILSDEVYDCLAYAPAQHIRVASVDGLADRTVTLGSAGKSFACTGWRIGWAVGKSDLIRPMVAATTRIVFCVSSPAQEAVATGLEKAADHDFFPTQLREYQERLSVVRKGLDALGLPYTVPEGGYFALVDIQRLQWPADFEIPDMIKDRPRDWHAAWFIAQTALVVSIPPTDFYAPQHYHLGEKYIRLSFAKDLDTLRDAGKRLQKLKPFIQ
ncbi:uncharacterized protein L969DRAFT_52903 [Mixia osmundae IAM 14324]|uniref:Aminotransferase class I/classII large domain-containing protein n=1 Tax=Mixia osmundae (strain CBS 9802 / IAM 14324 / JCM 22182 / KY 12970) TaxID=764103 RepID=G7E4N3_MIXOS|nr:uncharacterized protein L969DRAFT_52903 [Mixia osmundae IAM 14324]KEI37690.1 hypothetical protein L969DRAFT_52903 [Mixia osmundae IAM 14324]GAA97793.1 hypothetical protein E5Q_04472 [Mixia osmundae IAM 14324]